MGLEMTVIVTLLVTADPNKPEIRVVPNDIVTSQECDAWKAERSTETPDLIDRVSGRRVMMRFYDCVPINPDRQAQALKEAVVKYGAMP